LPAEAGLTEAYTEVSAANVVAYYDPKTERVSIIEGATSDPLEDLFALSHEFVHSLQDQDLSIDTYRSERATSLDAFMAVTALIEGEATVVGLAVTGRSQSNPPKALRWSAAIDSMWTSIFEGIDAAPAPFVAAIQGIPYPLGAEYIYPGWLDEGQANVDGIYAEPPLSVIDLEGRAAPGDATAAQPLDCYPTMPPAGFSAVGGESLGMTGALAMWMSTGQAAEAAWRSSVSWRGDSLIVFQSSAGSDVAAAWRTRWENSATATQIGTALEMSTLPGWSRRVVVEGTEVTLLVAADATLVSDWAATLQCGSLDDLATVPTLIPDATLRRLVHPTVTSRVDGVR
jgi:hypothetical protein